MRQALDPVACALRLRDAVEALRFAPPVACVYDPLVYAWDLHRQYLERYAAGRKRVLFLGMNPGPFGMAQTGVPFGEVATVRDWLGLSGAVGQPAQVHPRRPITGLACTRSEVSGRRLWGLFASRFGTAAAFAAEHLVASWCPLAFMTDSGANRTPDQLPRHELAPLRAACDRHLAELADGLDVQVVVGVGTVAAAAARRACRVRVVEIPHPSPANPAANHDWAGTATAVLVAGQVWSA